LLKTLLGLADQVAAAGIASLSLEVIQAEVKAVRTARRKPRAPRR
jgi:hypothetical protein